MPRTAETHRAPPVPVGGLPEQLRMLVVVSPRRSSDWLAAAFRDDSATQVQIVEVVGIAAGLSRVRDEIFDAIVLCHEPPHVDGLELLEGLRGGGCEEPVLVLGSPSEAEMATACLELGADAYVCLPATTTRNLLWTISRAIERQQLIRENRRLVHAEQHRLELEQHEAQRLLRQQRALLRQVDQLYGSQSAELEAGGMPSALVAHYRELLRAYVIMGTGNLAGELSRLANLLVLARVDGKQMLGLHLNVLGEQIQGLGNRSARHVLARADLLIVEVLLHLVESYRQQYRHQLVPPHQKYLPGFDQPPVGSGADVP